METSQTSVKMNKHYINIIEVELFLAQIWLELFKDGNFLKFNLWTNVLRIKYF